MGGANITPPASTVIATNASYRAAAASRPRLPTTERSCAGAAICEVAGEASCSKLDEAASAPGGSPPVAAPAGCGHASHSASDRRSSMAA